jgi:Winged helix DNA-binding domain
VLARKEVEALVGKERALGAGLWRDLVRVPPSGTWERRRADLFGDAQAWVGAPRGTAEEGVAFLVRRYLTGFGPAAPADIAGWAGLPATDVAAALARLSLRRFRTDDGSELVDLPRLPLPDPDTPAPARFLPTYDATLLAHARRANILPEEHRTKVFHTKMPQSVGTFLVDGSVAGIWRLDAGGRVVPEPFERLDAADRRAVDTEAERLTAFHA